MSNRIVVHGGNAYKLIGGVLNVTAVFRDGIFSQREWTEVDACCVSREEAEVCKTIYNALLMITPALKYTHNCVRTIAFTSLCTADGETSDEDLRAQLLKRVTNVDGNDEWQEACGHDCDDLQPND